VKHTLLQPLGVRSTLGACALAAATYACGSSAPTRELVDARRAYTVAEAGPASRLKPDALLTARQALSKAEAAHKEDPGSEAEAHLAYLAQRKAQIAVADAEVAAAKNDEDKAEEDYRQQLQRAASGNQAELQSTRQELANERAARTAAEARATEALKSLAQVATVNEEQRGTVITLSGSVLFPSGNDQLSSVARQSLDRVATVLAEQPDEKQIAVEGYTDSRGSDSFNQQLSQKRAEAVRGYLVTRGVPSERIQAVGRGEASPIAGNESAEGRANNRRVEIVIGDRQPGQPPAPR
jgi:outer membrane protein OmpA-like peptidoglycan-associated protein